jgi:hypothetical protein
VLRLLQRHALLLWLLLLNDATARRLGCPQRFFRRHFSAMRGGGVPFLFSCGSKPLAWGATIGPNDRIGSENMDCACATFSLPVRKSKKCHFPRRITHDKIYIVTNMIGFEMIRPALGFFKTNPKL